MRERVLVTGAAGFVGLALVRNLRASGCHVVGLIRDRTREVDADAVVYGDVTDRGLCRRLIADYEIDTVYHLAAQSIVSICADDPVTALDVAVMGTARLLQSVREVGSKARVIVSTSDKVYGAAPSPYTEATPLDARHSYEVSKACQDLVARMFHANYGVDVRVMRAVNIYGPGDPNESRLIPQTVMRCLRGEPPLVHAGAGQMRRQYIYIDDLVAALRTIADHGRAGDAYCAGSPSAPLSVLDVVAEIARQTGQSGGAIEVREREARFLEIQEQSADDRKLRSLGWTPTVAFADGIARTIDSYRSC